MEASKIELKMPIETKVRSRFHLFCLMVLTLLLFTNNSQAQNVLCENDSIVTAEIEWLDDIIDSLESIDCSQSCYSSINIYCGSANATLIYALESDPICSDVPTFYYNQIGDLICQEGSIAGGDCDSGFVANLAFLANYWQCGTSGSECDGFSVSLNYPTDEIICVGDTVTIFAEVTGGAEPYLYEWPPILALVQESFITVEATLNSTHIVNVFDSSGCSATAIISLNVENCDSSCGCPEIYDPVCVLDSNASGGVVTYDNACFAACDGFTTNNFVDCIGDSICVCPEIIDPVCVIDSNNAGVIITYENECYANCEGYFLVDFVDCQNDTMCNCPAVFDPVCIATPSGGFITFQNECFALCEGYLVEHLTECLDSSGQCTDTIGCVYPGDANNGLRVNNYDLLNIGFGYGASGPAREAVSIEPQYFSATDWNSVGINGVNLKYADCNGNGVVDADDIEAISQNYQINVDFEEMSMASNSDITINVNFIVDTVDVSGNPGDSVLVTIEADLNLEQINAMVPMHGLAMQMNFESDEATLLDVYVEFDENSWLTSNNDEISFQKFIPDLNRLDVALSRTDQIPVTGNGRIGRVVMIIEDIIIGRLPGETYKIGVDIENVLTIGNSSNSVSISGSENDVTVINSETITTTKDWLNSNIGVYPNPVSGELQIRTGIEIESIQLFSIDGQLIKSMSSQTSVDMNSLPANQYILKIITNDGVLTKQIIKAN